MNTFQLTKYLRSIQKPRDTIEFMELMEIDKTIPEYQEAKQELKRKIITLKYYL